MVEMRNGKKVLITPVSAEDLKDIKVGDIVYLDGSMTTCRDVAHRRLVEEGRELPVDVRNNAIFHAGPIIRPLENDKFEMVSVGPTTSMRMEKFEYDVHGNKTSYTDKKGNTMTYIYNKDDRMTASRIRDGL